ncbi:hypothetical protein ABZS76_33125 [Streptomyces sp. NPDC005562]|uniref:hypothetical protein n=1 Tax=Streptomyces sp. NPDC005562 TaxID=3154890 RepID=UPI0033B4428C
MRASKNDPEPIGPLAQKLRRLTILKFNLDPDTSTYPATEIADGCSRLYEQDKISAAREHAAGLLADEALEQAIREIEKEKPLLNRSYVSDLLHDKRDNPTKIVLQYLGKFYGVNPAYFFVEGEETQETRDAESEVELIAATRELKRKLEDGGQVNAGQLLTAMMRGANQLTPAMATGMIHMQLAAIDQATKKHGDA